MPLLAVRELCQNIALISFLKSIVFAIIAINSDVLKRLYHGVFIISQGNKLVDQIAVVTPVTSTNGGQWCWSMK